MNLTQRTALIVGAVAVAACIGLIVWLYILPPAPPPTPQPQPQPQPQAKKLQHRESTVDSAAYLVRLAADKDATDPLAFWDALPAEIAKDAAAQALLNKLCGGVRVKLVVLDTWPKAGEPLWEEKPAAGDDAVLRVTNKSDRLLRTTSATTKAGKSVPVEYVVGGLSLGLVIDTAPPAGLPAVKDGPLPPRVGAAFKLVVEDYLLRTKASWRGVHVGSFGEHTEFERVAESAGQSAEERRKDLDARIEEHAKQVREYLGSLAR